MEGEGKYEENKVEDNTEEEDISDNSGSETEEDSDEVAEESGKVTEEEATLVSEDNKKVSEQPPPHEEQLGFELDSSNDGGPNPDRESINSAQEEVDDNQKYEEHLQLFRDLCEERDKASQQNKQMQMKALDYFRNSKDLQLEQSDRSEADEERDYVRHKALVAKLKQQISDQEVTYQEQLEQKRLHTEDILSKADSEWKALVALKKDTVMKLLSRSLSKSTAQAKVESAMAIEQRRQDKLTNVRMYNIQMRALISKLEADLGGWASYRDTALQKEIEKVKIRNEEMQKEGQEKYEESSNFLKKIASNLEILSNTKEKLQWYQADMQEKMEQLAELEAMVVKKRDLLSRTKQAHNKLQRNNMKLKESRGLLGNRVLLRDFEDTVDTTEDLEEHLNNLKFRKAEAGRLKKKMETTQ